MKILLKNAHVYTTDKFRKCDVAILDNRIFDISPVISNTSDFEKIFDLNNLYLLPGLIDVHTHLREPGFIYKETIETGSLAAARGGYTSICAMPNLNPVPDSLQNLEIELKIIREKSKINVYPYGAITKKEEGKELSNMDEMSDKVIAFSDDGKGIQNSEMMEKAMVNAKKLNKIIAAHCEVNSLLNGGYIHEGEYSKKHNHIGICSESEWGEIKRDIELVRKTGCRYHICHVSTRESVEIIRKAKEEGLPVTCETAPHYLVLNDMDLKEDGRFKMNPPIRTEEDRKALLEGIDDGTIDMIITDHAPHSYEEKSKGLEKSLMGVVGLETSVPVLYTKLVLTKRLTLEKIVELMNVRPRKIFNIGTEIKVGEKADLTVFNFNEKYKINSNMFFSKGRSTPFDGEEVYGNCKLTICGGEIVFNSINR